MPPTETEILSPQCDNGQHYLCKEKDCACVCHDEEPGDPEDDDY